MKPGKPSLTQNEKVARVIRRFATADEVSGKASFSFANQTRMSWREVQRWLAAESKLIAEHRPARVHSIHRAN
jgi:hypothetical protein